jgi:hypothetical protein
MRKLCRVIGVLESSLLCCSFSFLFFHRPFFNTFYPLLHAYGITHKPPFRIALISGGMAPCTNLERPYVVRQDRV